MATTQPSECSIKVMFYFRPLNRSEERNGSSFTTRFESSNCCKVEDKFYAFDRVFQPTINQEHVYQVAAKPLIANVLCGYHSTIFAYGQTSSGKTYTMEGVVGDPFHLGIIPRVINEVFAQIAAADSDLRFVVAFTYFEIYMEQIRGLLDATKQNLVIREDKNRAPYVKDCTERTVNSADEIIVAVEDGKMIREIDSTNMNERSSRSHCVFLIKIAQEHVETQKKLTGKLCLVDLAASKKVRKTGAQGKQLGEAKKTNKFFVVFEKSNRHLIERSSFVPYRESKLTRILQESLERLPSSYVARLLRIISKKRSLRCAVRR